MPAATIAATNQSNSCIDTIVTLTANAGTSYTYKWQKSNVNIPAATSMVYNTASSGSYRAIVYNQFGCSRTSAALAIPIPIITASFTTNKTPIICLGDSVTLTANAGTGYLYQWQRNNANIAGATQRIFQAKVAGAYRVIVTNTMGCSAIAKSTTVTVNNCARVYTTGDEPGVVDLKFNIYPNPSMNSFTIENLSEVKTPVVFEIQDISGRVIKKGIIDFSEGNYHLGDDLLPGMYLFRVDAAGVRRTYRIEKIAD